MRERNLKLHMRIDHNEASTTKSNESTSPDTAAKISMEDTVDMGDKVPELPEDSICPDTGDMVQIEESGNNVEGEEDAVPTEVEDDSVPAETDITEADDNMMEVNIGNSDEIVAALMEDPSIFEPHMSEEGNSTRVNVEQINTEENVDESLGSEEHISKEKIATDVNDGEESFIQDDLPSNESESEFILNGEPIVMDDIAYDILATTLDKTKDIVSSNMTIAHDVEENVDDVQQINASAKPSNDSTNTNKMVKRKKTNAAGKDESVKKARKNKHNKVLKNDPSEKSLPNIQNKVLKITPSEKPQQLSARGESDLFKNLPKTTRIVFTPQSSDKPAPITSGDTLVETLGLKNLSKGVKITAIPESETNMSKGVKITAISEPNRSKSEQTKSAKKLKCAPCSSIFNTNEEFDNHVEKVHKAKDKKAAFTCEKCPGKKFEFKTKLREHIVANHSHKCQICKMNLTDLNSLKSHMENHKSKCSKCPQVFNTKLALVNHTQQNHNIKCRKCNKIFESMERYTLHAKQEHNFSCDHCKITLDFKAQLDQHIEKLHRFPCSSCGTVLGSNVDLASHEKEKHRSCDVCEDEFSWAEPGHSCYFTKNNIRPTPTIRV